MRECEKFQGALAASLYEVLEPLEARAFEAHLAGCPDCRREHAALRALTAAIPREPHVLAGDLRPVLREEVRRGRARAWFSYRLAAVVGLAAAVALVALLAPDRPTQPGPASVAANTPVETPVIAEARALAVSGNAVDAIGRLTAAIEAAPEAPEAGPLHLAIAEIEYMNLARYESSLDHYRRVRERFPDAWTASPGSVKDRYDLLLEAREANFEPLYQIDAARRQGRDGIPLLEQTLARHPGRGIARAAMETMVAMADGDGAERLEAARTLCTDPLAVAQLDVYVGERYCVENLDPARGRALLHAVAESPYPVPARMAEEALAKLER